MPNLKKLMLSVALMAGGSALAGTAEDPAAIAAEMYSRNVGVDAAEASARLKLQDEVGQIQVALTHHEWETFGGLYLQHTPDFRIIAQFTRDGAAAVQRHLHVGPYTLDKGAAARDGVIPIEVRTVRATLSQLANARDAGERMARELGIPANASTNVMENRAELWVRNKAELETALLGAKLTLPENLVVVEVDELARPAAEIYGGLAISTCTTGWSGQHSTGTRGIVTAGHCGNSQSWGTTALTYKSGVCGGNCDVQWHTASPHTPVAKFNAGSAVRSVTGSKPRSQQTVNTYVCKYGKTLGYRCGYIDRLDFDPGNYGSSYGCTDLNAVFVLVRSENTSNIVQPGDSGGPFFNANTAYGITSCQVGTSGCYNAIDAISACLSMGLLVQ